MTVTGRVIKGIARRVGSLNVLVFECCSVRLPLKHMMLFILITVFIEICFLEVLHDFEC